MFKDVDSAVLTQVKYKGGKNPLLLLLAFEDSIQNTLWD